jgi:hypothetical protein
MINPKTTIVWIAAVAAVVSTGCGSESSTLESPDGGRDSLVELGFPDFEVLQLADQSDDLEVLDCHDEDEDRVCDQDDICPGGDDRIDNDGDGVPDDCDACPLDDPDDSDGDGVCDSDDRCEGIDDRIDADGDGYPDECDLCPGYFDEFDYDRDTIPDDCDVCREGDDRYDSDNDGVPNACDRCLTGSLDSDRDGRPDTCDRCPDDNPNDSDGDGICDSDDACPGYNDFEDADRDMVPDGCDICPGGDDRVDSDEDGLPNACDCGDREIACAVNGTCFLSREGPTCVCLAGFTGDGFAGGAGCTDIDECETGTDTCVEGATCEDGPPGSYTCRCRSGFQGNGRSVRGTGCEDINECFEDLTICGFGTCDNLAPGYVCTCTEGYRLAGDPPVCVDIDECPGDPCGPGTCQNVSGSYSCHCPPGSESGGDPETCLDIDECSLDEQLCLPGDCEDLDGTYECSCPVGFETGGDPYGCIDIAECTLDPDLCTGGFCIDTEGNFECRCNSGWQVGETLSCDPIDECSADPCSPSATCTEYDDGFDCGCDEGFVGDGWTCLRPSSPAIWGGLDESRVNGEDAVLSTGAIYNGLRDALQSNGDTTASPTDVLTAAYLSEVSVFYTSSLAPGGGLLADEANALRDWVNAGGTLIVTGYSLALDFSDSFTSAFGVTDWATGETEGEGLPVSSHVLNAGVDGYDFEARGFPKTYGADALLIGETVESDAFLIVLDQSTGFQGHGRILVVGDYRLFTDDYLPGNSRIVGNVVGWAARENQSGCPEGSTWFGTDAFGYLGCKSTDTEILPCEDLSETGTILLECDDCTGVLDFEDDLEDFEFEFYSRSQLSVVVSSNGNLGFPTNNAAGRVCGGFGGSAISPFWTDLDARGGAVSYQLFDSEEDGRHLTIQWSAPHYPSAASFGTYDIRAVLHEDTDRIDFCYAETSAFEPLSDWGGDALIGIEGYEPRHALTYSCGEKRVMEGAVLHFVAPQNLLQNANFDSALLPGWAYFPGLTYYDHSSSYDIDGSPRSGAAQIHHDPTVDTLVMYQCAPVTAGRQYRAAAHLYYFGVGTAVTSVVFFDNAEFGCFPDTDAILEVSQTLGAETMDLGWNELGGDGSVLGAMTAPESSNTAMFMLRLDYPFTSDYFFDLARLSEW